MRRSLAVPSLVLVGLALGACNRGTPSPNDPLANVAETSPDSSTIRLGDTTLAVQRWHEVRPAAEAPASPATLWLLADGRVLWATDPMDGSPLDVTEGTYTADPGTDGTDTLRFVVRGDSSSYARTDSALVEAGRTLVEAQRKRFARDFWVTGPATAPDRAPSTNTPDTPGQAGREAVEGAAREAERLPGGSPRRSN